MLTILEITIRALKSFSNDRCPLFAASITYFSLISLFPLTLFAIGIAGFVLNSEGDQQRIVDAFTSALPLSQTEGQQDVRSLISSAVNARGALGLVGLLGTAYAGSALFGAVRASLTAVYEKEKRRPFLKAKLLDLALVLGFTSLLMLSVALTFLIALAQRFSVDLFGDQAATTVSWLLTLAYPTAPAAVSFLVFFLLYTVVAAAGLRKRDAAWGALIGAFGFEALKVGFAQYVAHFGNYDATYGTIGFLVALLAFFYFGAQMMLLGAEVAEAHMLVALAEPPNRLREVRSLRDSFRTLRQQFRRPFHAVREENRRKDLSRPAPASRERAKAENPPGNTHALPPGEPAPGNSAPAPQRARANGFGAFLSGLLVGIAAALALRGRSRNPPR